VAVVKTNKKIEEDIRSIKLAVHFREIICPYRKLHENCSLDRLMRWMRREKISTSGELPLGGLIIEQRARCGDKQGKRIYTVKAYGEASSGRELWELDRIARKRRILSS